MHWVGSWSKSDTFGAAVGSSTCLLAIHHVGSDGEQRQSRTGIFVNRKFLQFFAEEIDQVNTQVVYLVVVITEAREFALNIETFCQTDVVAACSYFGIFDGRQ